MDVRPVDIELDRPGEGVVGRFQPEGPDVRPQVLDQADDAVVMLERTRQRADVEVPQWVPARLQDGIDEVVARGEQRVLSEEGKLVFGKASGERAAGEIGMEQTVHHFLAEVRDAAHAHVGQQRPFVAQRNGNAEIHSRGQHRRETAHARLDEIVVRPKPQGDAAPREIGIVEGVQRALQVGSDVIGGQRDAHFLQFARKDRIRCKVIGLVGDARPDIHPRPVEPGDEELLAVGQVRNVVLEVVVKGAEPPAVAGQRGAQVQGREVVQVEGIVCRELEVLPDPAAEIHLGAGQTVGIQTDADQHRGALHAVRAQAKSEGVDRRGGAMENQPVRLMLAVQGIGHRLEGAGSLQAAHRRVNGRFVQRLGDVQRNHARDAP